MTETPQVSAIVSGRERTGLCHIGRLVELWLARYEAMEAANASSQNRFVGRDRNRRRGSGRLSSPKSTPRALPVAAAANGCAEKSLTQNMFVFYQDVD